MKKGRDRKSMKITFPEKQSNVAELILDGNPVNYRLPPVTGTHSDCFKTLNSDSEVRVATGKEIVAYICGALVYGRQEWEYQDRIRFPTKNHLKIPKVLTIVPQSKKYGDLAGAMLVDSDLAGEGVRKQTEIPKNLDGWVENSSKLFVKDGRFLIPYIYDSSPYSHKWNAKTRAVIAIFDGEEAAEELGRIVIHPGGGDPRFFYIDPGTIKIPKRFVPYLYRSWFYNELPSFDLDCSSDGDEVDGCAVGVLK